MAHLWQVTSTESGLTKGREYRCQRCGVLTRDDDAMKAPECTQVYSIADQLQSLRFQLQGVSAFVRRLEEELRAEEAERRNKP
jgi:hypothetical protein